VVFSSKSGILLKLLYSVLFPGDASVPMVINSPVRLMQLAQPSRPVISVCGSWDSLHTISAHDNSTVTTGRWRQLLGGLEDHVVQHITDAGQKTIVTTDKRIIVMDGPTVYEQDRGAVTSLYSMQGGTVYALLNDGQFCLCDIVTADGKDRVSIEHPLPMAVTVEKVSVGSDHTLLLTSVGTLYSFGLNSRGQLGHGDIVSRAQPSLVEALDGLVMKDIACGTWHCMALSAIGDVYSWGWNQHKQLGHSSSTNTVAMPTLVEMDTDIVSIDCGSRHSLALTQTGVVYGWGWGAHGQLGGSAEVVYPPKPISMPEHCLPVSVHCQYWNSLIVCASQT